MRLEGNSVGALWERLLSELYHGGRPVSPRGLPCRERLGVTLSLEDATHNVFSHPARGLSYRFMVAEWLWIWFGHNDVATIAPYNPNIGQFSDDGLTFFGAYGPRFIAQWPRVLASLQSDADSRQAVVTVFRSHPPKTKDVPCTLSWQALLRHGAVHSIVSMRSSDVWLGLEYDCFTFTMLQNILAAQLGANVGSFTIHLGSSHLYDRDRDRALEVLSAPIYSRDDLISPILPGPPPAWLEKRLTKEETSQKWITQAETVSPWMAYALVLEAVTNASALLWLRDLSRSCTRRR